MQRTPHNSKDVQLSKTLSYILRHGAQKEGLKLSADGFVPIQQLLQHRQLRNYILEDVKRVVDSNDKQRFRIRTSPLGLLEIRANQGHSIKNVDNLELTPISSPFDVPNVIHGTYISCWSSIRNEGLSRMGRNHIHFAQALPTDKSVISGMRRTCQVYIYIDLKKALNDGLQFYISVNGVVLSPGNSHGVIEPKYFYKVLNATDGSELCN